MKHYGDNSNPNPLNRFMADEDSMTIHDSDETPDYELPKDSDHKESKTAAWDAEVIPE